MKATSMPESPDDKASKKIILPRWLALAFGLFAWLVVLPLVHCGLPWAISLLTRRSGWIEGKPGIFNLFGLVSVISAIVCLIWILVLGIAVAGLALAILGLGLTAEERRWIASRRSSAVRP